MPADATEAAILTAAKADEKIQPFVAGKSIPASYILIRVTPQFVGVFTIPGPTPKSATVGLEVYTGDAPNPCSATMAEYMNLKLRHLDSTELGGTSYVALAAHAAEAIALARTLGFSITAADALHRAGFSPGEQTARVLDPRLLHLTPPDAAVCAAR